MTDTAAVLPPPLTSLSKKARPRRKDLAREDRVNWLSTIPYALFHVAAIAGAVVFHPTVRDLVLAGALYVARMAAVTGGYHRYFSHRSFQTSRAFQFVLALFAGTAVQKGPLWWAATHRHHHRYSDQPEDVHSPTQRGFWYAHMGWVFAPRFEQTRLELVPDLAKYPELRWLDRFWLVPQVGLAVLLFALGGAHGLVWGFFVSTVLLWQGTYSINSFTHLFGRRRFPTTDTSRNSLTLALITLGEGWHNNHHYYQGSMRQGFYWWQVDLVGYFIRALEKIGVVWNVRKAPQRVLDLGRRHGLALGEQVRAGAAAVAGAVEEAVEKAVEKAVVPPPAAVVS